MGRDVGQCQHGHKWNMCVECWPDNAPVYKKDQGKPDMALLGTLMLAIVKMARIREFGEKKYSREGWIEQARDNPKEVRWSRSWNGALRHMILWLSGQKNASDSNELHLAHAMTDLAFLIVYEELGLGTDDRAEFEGLADALEAALYDGQ